MLWAALGAALVALLAAVELGQVNVKLPFPPGVEYDYMADPPPGVLPPKFDSSFSVDNNGLTKAQYIFTDKVKGIETVAVSADGRLGLVDRFGRVFIANPDGQGGYSLSSDEPLAWSSPGAVLGVKFDLGGNLMIANAPLGLWQLVSPGEELQKLVLAAGRVSDNSPLLPGYPIEFANSIDIGLDGLVYFSCSTDVLPYKTVDGSWNVMDSVYVTLAKGAPAGMLLVYDTTNGETKALMDKLWFANGVALSMDNSYVLVADSIQGKVFRYWLQGPTAGSHDVFMENLPGPPDGIHKAADGGSYWITIYSEAPGIVKYSDRRLVRLLLAWVPRIMRWFGLQAPRQGLVLQVDTQGNIIRTLADPKGEKVWGVTSAVESDGKLFLGSLHSKGLAVLDLQQVAQQ